MLTVTLNGIPMWSIFCKKASKRLYLLRVLKPVWMKSYNGVLLAAALYTLKHRRSWLCDKYMKRITINSSHPINALLPCISDACPDSLRAEKRDIHFFRDGRNRNLNRTEEFFTFRYFL